MKAMPYLIWRKLHGRFPALSPRNIQRFFWLGSITVGPKHYFVLGAGTVGVCCARYLLREHKVTLIDRDPPAMGCSFGNAGILQVGGVVPLAMPGILRQVPRMLADPDGPLVIRWQHLVRLAPYLARFVLSAHPARTREISQALADILQLALPAYQPLFDSAHAHYLIRKTGEFYVYRSLQAYEAAQEAHRLRASHGLDIEEIPQDQIRQLEPALAPVFTKAVLFPECQSTIDPHRLTIAIFDDFRRSGGEFIRADLRHIKRRADGTKDLVLGDQTIQARDIVLAFGAYSKKWAKLLGAPTLPIDTERGYHLMLANPGVSLNRPVVVGDDKFGLSSMVDGLRIAGTAELAKLDAPPNFQRAHRLLKLARHVLPDLSDKQVVPWMGHRPSTPDSLPVIGRSPGDPQSIFAFGHGHGGLTLGGITGQIVADIAAGREPPIDISPFAPGRF